MNRHGRSGEDLQTERAGRRHFRLAPIAQAMALVLAAGGVMSDAQAQRAFSSAWFGKLGAIQNNAAATGLLPNGKPVSSLTLSPAQQQRNDALVQKSINNLNLAARSIAAQQAAQAAARQAAMNGPEVPDGLTRGGLEVDTNSLTAGWVNANKPVQTVADGKTSVEIQQTSDRAILDWSTFNVGRNTTVDFKQDPSWAVLNRVNDPNARPSQIQGQIKADGSVYLINRNGILFSGTSQINTRSLTASSLDIHGGPIEYTRPNNADGTAFSDEAWEKVKVAARDQRFQDGLNDGSALPTFGDSAYIRFDAGNTSQPDEVFDPLDGVTVEAGAQLNIAAYGQAVLLGHNVTNKGTISAPDGQVLLASGRQIYLEDGLLRQVNSQPGSSPGYSPATASIRGYIAGTDRGGVAENDGLIDAARGNVSLVGKDVTQNGVLAVTTAIDQQGSIILDASTADGVVNNSGIFRGVVGNGQYKGTVNIGSGSTMSILPDDSGKTAVGNPFQASDVEIIGNKILFQDNSTLYAPGAQAFVLASESQFNPNPSRLYIGTGSVFDVSGLAGVQIDMSANSITAELRANELANNPVMQNSPLRGETVYFDARLGGKLSDGSGVADLSGYYNLISRDVDQFMTTGGSIRMSGSEIIAREGSLIDLSGGSVHYNAGLVRSTVLIDTHGNRVPIEQAQAGVLYVGVDGDFVVNHPRWGVTERFASVFAQLRSVQRWDAYDEGRSAGTLTIDTVGFGNSVSNDYARIFDGDVRAGVLQGPYQTNAPAGAGITDVTKVWQERPALGALVISQKNSSSVPVGGNITVADELPGLASDFAADSPLFDYSHDATSLVDGIKAHDVVLPAKWFDGNNFGQVSLHSGDVDVPKTGVDQETGQQYSTPPAFIGGVLTVGADVTINLGDYGSFKFVGRQANIDGSILAPGGSVALETVWAPYLAIDFSNQQILARDSQSFSDIALADRPGTHLGATGLIDVAGRWTNAWQDLAAGNGLAPAVVNGGKVQIVGYDISLDAGSRIDVGGGAYLAGDGKTLTLGNGGSIVLDTSEGYRGASPSPIAAPSDGRLEMNGTLAGYAPGKGGTLTVNTPDAVVIANQPILADGVLKAGTPAPTNVTLPNGAVLPAGSILPFDVSYDTTLIPGGGLLTRDATVLTGELEGAAPLAPLAAPWTLPKDAVGGYVQGADGHTYQPGDTVPAGTQLVDVFLPLKAGYTLPKDVFPAGLDNSLVGTPTGVLQKAGVLAQDFHLVPGFIIPKGASFGDDLAILTPKTVTPDFFTHGGFSGYQLSGSSGMSVQSGTTIAPSVDKLMLDGGVRDIATGASLIDFVGKRESGVSLINSATLPADQRPAMDLALSTLPTSFDLTGGVAGRVEADPGGVDRSIAHSPGILRIDAGATIAMSGGSQVLLDAAASHIGSPTILDMGTTNIFVDGVISALGGSITIAPFSANDFTPVDTLRIGDNARLLAGGYVKTIDDGHGNTVRSIVDGGNIRIGVLPQGLDSNLLVALSAGAVLDVSGVSGIADLDSGNIATWHSPQSSRYVPTEIDGDAGSIFIAAHSGLIAADLRLAAGGSRGQGGALTVTNTGSRFGGIDSLVVRQSMDNTLSAGPSSAIAVSGLTLIADSIAPGVGTLQLSTQHTGTAVTPTITFDGDVSLVADRTIILDSDHLARTVAPNGAPGMVNIVAPYVSLNGAGDGSMSLDTYFAAATDDLNGTLTVRANLIDLSGALSLDCSNCAGGAKGGFGTVRLVSSGDTRLVPGGNPGDGPGLGVGIFAPGTLEFDGAQLYVANSDTAVPQGTQIDRIDADPGYLVQAGKSITVRSNGAAAPVPLNFGERFTLRAPDITQAGVLRAPQGQIRLEASNTLTLAPGSLTSASLEGMTVPFGFLNLSGLFTGYDRADWTPTKSVTLAGATVDMQTGATVDVSGGGDLLGWTFQAGNGGTRDVLADQAASGAFAILPSFKGSAAPVRGSANPTFADKRLAVGDSIWLTGVPGLADGYYVLLPAHYALLDGGMLVKPLKGSFASPLGKNAYAEDGSVVASGFRAVANTPMRDAAWSAFEVQSGDTWKQYSQFNTFSFDAVKTQQATTAGLAVRTVADAGSVTLNATTNLNLAGTAKFGAANGLVGNLDIAGTQIALTNPDTDAPDGFLKVDADQLSNLGAGSVLIGGTRPRTSYTLAFDPSISAPGRVPTGTGVTTTASDVLVAPGTIFSGNELLLAATNSVSVGEGAQLTATGAAKTDPNDLLLSGDGAFLRLSSNDRVGTIRTNTPGVSGVLTIGSNAVLKTSGALSLDASSDFALASNAFLDVAKLDLSSARINLGDVPTDAPGTTIGLDTVARLALSSDLLLRGHNSIDLYGDVVLGARGADGKAQLASLTLDTALLQGHAIDGASGGSLTAGTLTLTNSTGAVNATPEAGTGVLAFDVDTLALGPGTTTIGGYQMVNGTVGQIIASGTGALNLAGAATFTAGLVTADNGADYAITATGDLAFAHGVAPVSTGTIPLGGQLTLTGANLSFDTTAQAAGGQLTMTAASGTLVLGEHALLDASGRAVDFRDTVKYAQGGSVRLASAGDLAMDGAAVIDVSGDGRGGNAGLVQITAGGRAALDGAIRGDATAGYAGGEFALDANRTDFTALNAALNTGKLDASRDIHLRGQDIVLAAGDRIEAHRVALTSDNGKVEVAGTIAAAGDAGSPDGGDVRLIGRDVSLDASGRIEAGAGPAPANGYGASSGTVELAANGGRVTLADGSTIDVSGGRDGGGRVTVRADRDGAGIKADIDGGILGARTKSLIGMAGYQADTIDGGLAATMLADASAWLANAAPVAGWNTGAGLQVASAGDLTVASDVDMSSLHGGGYLGLSATGDIVVDANINDGFANAAKDATLNSGNSSDYRFDAGRDVVIGNDHFVRTGTGDIHIGAGRDIVLANDGSTIYTAGSATPTAAGFDHTGFGDLQSPGVLVLGAFPTQGGDISLQAGRDIRAPIVNQSASAWLFRYGGATWDDNPANTTVTQQTSWSIVYRNFASGVGALGGGNVRVRAGGDVQDLGVAIPTSGHLTTPLGQHAVAADLIVRGGGDLDLRAGGDVLGGFFTLGRGHAEVDAAGTVGQGAITTVPINGFGQTEQRGLSPLFGLMDADARVTGGGDVTIEGAYDPMMSPQICENIVNCSIGSAFVGYSAQTALNATSVGGRFVYSNNGGFAGYAISQSNPDPAFQIFPGNSGIIGPITYGTSMMVSPASLRFAALRGDIQMRANAFGGWALAPSPVGTLELLAFGDIGPGAESSALVPQLTLQDVGTDYIRNGLAPSATDGNNVITTILPLGFDGTIGNNFNRGNTPLHLDDPEPVRVFALNGSIKAMDESSTGLLLNAPKPVELYAGLDLVTSVVAQNNRSDQVSSAVAGRDLVGGGIATIAGPGQLWLEAGRDFRNFSVRSIGNGTANPVSSFSPNYALADVGADINVIAGTSQGTAYSGFANRYLDPANQGDPTLGLSNPENVGKVVHTYQKELDDFLHTLGFSDASSATDRQVFASLAPETQRAFLQTVLVDELRETGIDYNDADSPRFKQYTRGYEALATLFPSTGSLKQALNPLGGNISINDNVVESLSGGSISLLAPYGRIDVGNPADVVPVPVGNGIITRRGGNISMLSNGNIDLDLSRVFTLQGGDVLMWTSNGDITAGAGAKTSVQSVPLAFQMDRFGEMTIDSFGLQTGAGIGVLDAFQGDDPNRRDSRLDLLAFFGEVNAGDAGIRVVGDLNIAALRVVNADNIQVTGQSKGVPVVAAVNVGALTNASAAASTAAMAAQDVVQRERAATRQALPSIFTVRVLGFGTEPAGSDQERPANAPSGLQPGPAATRYDPKNLVQVIGLGGTFDPNRSARLTDDERRLLLQDK